MNTQKTKRVSVSLATPRSGSRNKGRESTSSTSSRLPPPVPPPGPPKMSQSAKLTTSAAVGSSSSGFPGGDKTVCQYCGLSYLTATEMRSLQTAAKELEAQINVLQETQTENMALKDRVKECRLAHIADIHKQDEAVQKLKTRCLSLEDELAKVKEELAESVKKCKDISEKFEITSEDHNQQEEVICQLRDLLEVKRDEIAFLHNNMKQLDAKVVALSKNAGLSTAKTVEGTKDEGKPKPSKKERDADSSDTSEERTPAIGLRDVLDQHLASKGQQSMNPIRTNNSGRGEIGFSEKAFNELKIENENLKDELDTLKAKYDVSLLRMDDAEQSLKNFVVKYDRLKVSVKECKRKAKSSEENTTFPNGQKMIADLQRDITNLQQECLAQKNEMDQAKKEYEKKLAGALREAAVQKAKAESLLASLDKEKKNIENDWKSKFSESQKDLARELESLRVNYERMLNSSKDHEDLVVRELELLRSKSERSKVEWEKYREQLNEQIVEWKARYDQKQYELGDVRKAKSEIERISRENSDELFQLQEIVHFGDAERKDLRRKVSKLEDDLKEQRRLRYNTLAEKYPTYDIKARTSNQAKMNATNSTYDFKKLEMISRDIPLNDSESSFTNFGRKLESDDSHPLITLSPYITPSKVPLPDSSSESSNFSNKLKSKAIPRSSKYWDTQAAGINVSRKSGTTTLAPRVKTKSASTSRN